MCTTQNVKVALARVEAEYLSFEAEEASSLLEKQAFELLGT